MVLPPSACQLASFFIGIAEICYMSSPVGNCLNCCAQDDKIDIQYKLFTRSNPTQYQIIPLGDQNALRATNFNMSHPTIIYLMGFSEAVSGVSTRTLREAHLTSAEYNFISVDWSRLIVFPCFHRKFFMDCRVRDEPRNAAKITQNYILHSLYYAYIRVTSCEKKLATLFNGEEKHREETCISENFEFQRYISAVKNTRHMGTRLADFIQFLDGAGILASSIHVIGFSLGAEAAGFAGKELKRRGLSIGRITGLDPAYPGYSLTNSDAHLARGDAIFVDVVHTNPGIFGFPLPIGDVDFYPNPGKWIQPGCWVDELIKNREFRFIYGCSHVRAWRLYAESLSNPLGFPATLCRDWKSATSNCQFQIHGYLGIGAGHPMSGKMYLETRDSPPFAKNGP